ncbi:hypothetical protein S40285_08381 [Stachybotrys chlorohalonatus IBT 40285]|uniref:Uncharacterized protein n=1 Tax=Stachybotrys chlorohalonatus (strain IBT 40285) TaxID=1283841 RepID=A0A084QYE4_STAC4|nr:hypothetical protein S40285_08381 [Stachybotrys chlorohalonata IBT 40285]
MNNISNIIYDSLQSDSPRWKADSSLALYALAGLSLIPIFQSIKGSFSGVKAQVVGHRSFFEPQWLVRHRFIKGSAGIIQHGYDKFKESMFKIRRQDGDILVISQKFVDQLRSLPEKQLSSTWAQVRNLHGHYTTLDALITSNLHIRVIQQRLTPNLAASVPIMEKELKYALDVEMPKCDDDWAEVKLFDLMMGVITRLSNRVFVGPEICRNDEWLGASVHFGEAIAMTTMTLRMIPSWMHFFIGPLLPSYWQIRKHLKTAERLLSPVIRERQAQSKEERGTPDLLQHMMDLASPDEQDANFLARRQLLVSFGALHTTAMAATHTLYDLAAYQEYFEPLRAEIAEAIEGKDQLDNQTILKLPKMDSFMKESQRANPPSLLSFHRYVRTPVKLNDGTVFPAGTHFAMAADAVLHDKSMLPGGGDPDVFDGFRYSRLREDPDNQNRYLFAQTDNNHLHFGHGRCACPGRFFSSVEIKVLFIYLLTRYDWKYPEGKGRPENFSAEESRYPDPSARVLIKRRKDAII